MAEGLTRRIVFRRAAQRDLQEAVRWYEARRTGLGAELVALVDTAVITAAATPERFPRMHRNVRCIRVRRFPYSVLFFAEPQRLVVLAIFHARRDPLVWQSRV